MPDPIAKAFLSYSHLDNDRESDRILRLASHIKNEFALQTGSEIEIFTDRSDILWGDDWRERIEEALQETTFFIPVLTPTYFVRDECRREMTRFYSSAGTLGLRKLLLSIRYLPVPDLREDSVDELKAKAAALQFEPWHELRLRAEDSPEHRQAIHRLASRLVHLTQELEGGGSGENRPIDSATLISSNAPRAAERPGPTDPGDPDPSHPDPPSTPSYREVDDDDEDDEDGPIDVLVDAQPAMNAWAETLTRLPIATASFNEKFRATTEEMNLANAQPNAFAMKVQAMRRLAHEIEPELVEIESLSKEYSERLTRVDRVIRAMYDVASFSNDDSTQAQVAQLSAMVGTLIESSRTAKHGLQQAADAARVNARLSKDLRPVLRRFETAVRNIIDGSTLIESWGEL